ncbi:TPR repeat protein [Candidatus Koribacter versatilis Ellin345]|uniref:protein O-GlcNAc transferase n=1 Tax=Koribacter versatilis (strain Ellin345) TaxID=204669 RepID=Q1IHC3_KORVE|nr:tetratricopeptide repeat protein [Candidatus Koribacter versatilis]ABF43727.1 TPR repeat protein [Candidatus Koribacter versatilis Ellin345]
MTTKIGRNDRCPCGSGKKYKLCCLVRPSNAARLMMAREHHEAGRLQPAAKIYEQVLRGDPNNVEALHSLSILASQIGETATAERLMRQVLSLQPEHVGALSNLGITLQSQGRQEDAIACYEKVIALRPHHAEAHNNLGNLRLAQGDLEQAIASYQRALDLKPDYADAHYNLGNAYQRRGNWTQARESYRRAVASRPEFPEAQNNLGVVLREMGETSAAIEAFERAIALRAEYADPLNNLGVALQEQGRMSAAVEHYHQAIALRPADVEAHFNLGSALQELHRTDEAIAAYQSALEIQPGYLPAYSNLLLLYASTGCVSPAEELAFALGWERAALTEEERAEARSRRFVRTHLAGRKLRIGIVSAELGEHAVADFLEPLLSEIDRSQFELLLFPTRLRDGARTQRLHALGDKVISLAQVPDAAAAEVIRKEGVDVLIDTTGHTRGCRLGIFAHRAAPVQMTWIGYWSTTGLTEVDWVLADDKLPASFDAHFCEGIWRVPRLPLVYRGDTALPQSAWTPSADGTLWFGSLNRYSKIGQESLDLWAKVMEAVPKSKLLLEDRTADDTDAHQRISAELATHGIGADRIEFEPYIPGHERHMRLYDRVDVALDTIPLNSGTTACDALWMGVPLVAMEGNRTASRIAAGFLRAIGRTEWIADSEQNYISKVVELSNNVELRKQLRGSQRQRMVESSLCDARGLARELEQTFVQMFDRWTAAQTS